MPDENPFSSRFVRPGAISYRLPPGHDLPRLIDRFQQIGRRGQIVGPHGGGKSTLLSDLVRLWEHNGERVVILELHDGQRHLHVSLPQLQLSEQPTLIAVDGFEQLGLFARCRLLRFCRRQAIGLVVTTHRSMGIPDLVRCAPSLETVQRLVHDLLPSATTPIDPDTIRRIFHHHQGNVREILFEMYDLYEAQA